VQLAGENYLAATDTRNLVKGQLIAVSHLTRMLQKAAVTGLVFLDSCRDNPLLQGKTRAWAGTTLKRGLAPVQGGQGLFIAYATAPGKKAEDGRGTNSPFTKAQARQMTIAGIDIDEMMRRVTAQVESDTKGRQIPWKHSSLRRKFIFKDAPAQTLKTASVQQWQTTVRPAPPAKTTLPRRASRHRKPSKPYPGQRFRDGTLCPLLEAVTERPGAAPVFAIAVTPISNADWQSCMSDGACPDTQDIVSDRPVSDLSRFEIQPYLNWLNENCANADTAYTLPSSDQWAIHQRWKKRDGQPKWQHLSARRNRPHAIGAPSKALGLWEWSSDCETGNDQELCAAALLLPPRHGIPARLTDPATRSPDITFRVVRPLM
jgi:hypothetical protein